MKKVRDITYTDLLILAIIVIINPTSTLTPYHSFKAPCIPDKVEIRYTKTIPTDSIANYLKETEAQLSEMKYYLKVHNVTDEGYNQVARYNATLMDRKVRLAKLVNSTSHTSSPSQTITIPAKDRPLIAVKLSKGYWRAGHYHFTPLNGKAITRDDPLRVTTKGVLYLLSMLQTLWFPLFALTQQESIKDRWMLICKPVDKAYSSPITEITTKDIGNMVVHTDLVSFPHLINS